MKRLILSSLDMSQLDVYEVLQHWLAYVRSRGDKVIMIRNGILHTNSDNTFSEAAYLADFEAAIQKAIDKDNYQTIYDLFDDIEAAFIENTDDIDKSQLYEKYLGEKFVQPKREIQQGKLEMSDIIYDVTRQFLDENGLDSHNLKSPIDCNLTSSFKYYERYDTASIDVYNYIKAQDTDIFQVYLDDETLNNEYDGVDRMKLTTIVRNNIFEASQQLIEFMLTYNSDKFEFTMSKKSNTEVKLHIFFSWEK